MKHFKLLSATHTQNGKTYNKGDVVPSQYNLDKLFLGKFEVVSEPTAAQGEPGQSPAAPADGAAAPSANAGATAPAKSALGEDVTAKFPKAVAAELKVFRKGKSHFVTQPDAADIALNEEPLTDKQVDGFIAKSLA
jgi:hypothetical protein